MHAIDASGADICLKENWEQAQHSEGHDKKRGSQAFSKYKVDKARAKGLASPILQDADFIRCG